MKLPTLSRLVALPVLLASAACGGDATDLIAPSGEPSLGVTVRVTVNCATPLKPGQQVQCTAYGYDSNNVFTSSSAGSWASSNTSVATVTSGGLVTAVATGTTSISAVVDGITGSKTVAVQPEIAIDGPDTVEAGEVCTFFSDVISGTAPFTYSWWSSYNWVHDYGYTDDEPWNWTGHSTGTGTFTIYLKVTDASGQSTTVSKSVNAVSNTLIACFI